MHTKARMSSKAGWGPYDQGREIGSGGMGRVYEATHRASGRRVALKVTFAGVPANLVAQHQREAELLSATCAPRVPRVHDRGVVDDQVWIAMDYIEGEPLAAALNRGALSMQQRLQIMRDVAETVDHLRRDGVVHGDIKPANIVLDRDGRPWLIDFGVAMREGATPSCVLGTPQIMAPEQLQQTMVTHRADVFQLGVLAYDLFAAQRPWASSMLAAVALAIAERPPADFISVLADAAMPHRSEMVRLARVVAKSLALDPDHRPQCAWAWVGALDRIIDACAVQAAAEWVCTSFDAPTVIVDA
ncbi:MAG: serine/threonine-protein kinase [Myxococcota bacterium]